MSGRPPSDEPRPDPSRDIDVPDTVDEIVLLGDGDSDRLTTEMALRRAAKRWGRAGRSIKIAWAPDGYDFNDVLVGPARPRT